MDRGGPFFWDALLLKQEKGQLTPNEAIRKSEFQDLGAVIELADQPPKIAFAAQLDARVCLF